jgi:hypothetical protein
LHSCCCTFFLMWWSVLVFYLVNRSHRNSKLNWIQISLQIIKRLEKENWFSNSYSAMGRNPVGHQARPGQPLHSTPPLSVSTQPTKRPTRPNLPEPSSVPKPAQWTLPLPEHGAARPWPPMPALAALPCAIHRWPTEANRVHRSVLSEYFRAKEQNWGIIKEMKMNPQWNWNESLIWLEIRFGMKSSTRMTPFTLK